MMETKNLAEVFKSLPIASDAELPLRFVFGSQKSNPRLGNVMYHKSDKNGANILYANGSKGVALVIAVDNNNQDNYLIYVYIKLEKDKYGKIVTLVQNGISVYASNTQSTVALTGSTSITQHVLIFG